MAWVLILTHMQTYLLKIKSLWEREHSSILRILVYITLTCALFEPMLTDCTLVGGWKCGLVMGVPGVSLLIMPFFVLLWTTTTSLSRLKKILIFLFSILVLVLFYYASINTRRCAGTSHGDVFIGSKCYVFYQPEYWGEEYLLSKILESQAVGHLPFP